MSRTMWRTWTLLGSALTGLGLAAPVKDNTITGKIVDWPAGAAGQIRVNAFWSGASIVTARIAKDGSFTLVLPDPAKMGRDDALRPLEGLFAKASNFYADCAGEGQVSPSAGKYLSADLLVYVEGGFEGDLEFKSAPTPPRKGFATGRLYYFAQPTTLSGRLSCPYNETQTLSGTYGAGWNLVRNDYVLESDFGALAWALAPAGKLTDLSWRLYTEYGGVGLQLKPDSLVVAGLAPGQAAERAGLKVGDEILTVGGKAVKTDAEAGPLLRGDPDTKVTLTVRRAGESAPVTIEITRGLIRRP